MSWFFKDAEHSRQYLRYRPTYPSKVFETILSQLSTAKSNERWSSALDVGCGTGQATLPLSDHFVEVIGIDSSESQLNVARQSASDQGMHNVKYVHGEAHDLSFRGNDSADLITAALSAHWFESLNTFYGEALRVLKPGGILAVYGYGIPSIVKAEGHQFLKQMFKDKLGKYWGKELKHVDNRYSEIYDAMRDAFPDCQRDDSIELHLRYAVDEFISYLTTWSIYQRYRQENSNVVDPMQNLRSGLLSVFTNDSEEDCMEVHFPVFILLGKKVA